MPEKYTLKQIRSAIVHAYMNTHFDEFVITILQRVPNENDTWQIEKWEGFQDLCKGIVRFPEEYFANVIHTNST